MTEPMNDANLGQLLRERADALSVQPLDPDSIVARGQAKRRQRRVAGGSVVVACVAAAVVAAITISSGNGSAERPARILPVTIAPTPTIGPTSSSTPSPSSPAPIPVDSPPPLPAGWTAIPTPPNAPDQGFYVSTRVGSRIAYWGGEIGQDGGNGYSNQGAVLDPETRTWSAMTPSPLQGRIQPAIAGSDGMVFIWGGDRIGGTVYGDGATYDVTTRTWKTVSKSPLGDRAPLGAVWTGTEFLVVGGTGSQLQHPVTEAAAYNPANDTWRSLPSLPTAPTAASILRVGVRTVVIGTDAPPNGFGSNVMYVLSDGDTTWRTYPTPSNMQSATLTATTDGTTIFAAAGPEYLNVPRSDPSIDTEATIVMSFTFESSTWQDLRNPFVPINCYPHLAATAQGVWEFGCISARYDRATQTWRQLSLPGGDPIVVGNQIVLSGHAIGLDP